MKCGWKPEKEPTCRAHCFGTEQARIISSDGLEYLIGGGRFDKSQSSSADKSFVVAEIGIELHFFNFLEFKGCRLCPVSLMATDSCGSTSIFELSIFGPLNYGQALHVEIALALLIVSEHGKHLCLKLKRRETNVRRYISS